MWFEYKVYGEKSVTHNLERFGDRATDMRPVLEMIAMRFHGEAEMQFASEGSHAGTPWDPLSAWRLAQKRLLGYPDDILVATGALRKSLTRENAEGSIDEVTRDSLHFGTTIPYAWRHQKGEHENPNRKLPKRPVLVVTREFEREIVKRLQRFLVEGEVTPGRERVSV